MASVEISELYPPIRGEDIVQVEEQLGFSLPADYRAFLLVHNGGSPSPNMFPIAGDVLNDRGMIERFFCIRKGDMDDLLDIVQTYRNRVPANFLPIAYDPGDNLLCLSIAGTDTGKIYFWDHEEESEVPGYDNVYFVANSFNDLLKSLTA